MKVLLEFPKAVTLGLCCSPFFFNDVTNVLPRGCRILYADDLKIFLVIRNPDDCVRLQNMLSHFYDWCERNKMSVSVSKCFVISFHRKSSPINFNYKLAGCTLNRTTLVRDLGVMLDSNLSFNQHRCMVIDKANRQLGFIAKISREFTDLYCLKALYCSLVRSILETADIIWTPYQSTWIERIEKIQKRFLRHTLAHLPWNNPANLPPYTDRCRLLNMDTLENRRRANQALFVAKLLKGEVDAPMLLSLLPVNIPSRPFRRYTFLRQAQHRTNYGSNAPLPAMIAEFSRVQHLFDFNLSSGVFKNRVLEYLRAS